LIVSGIFTLAIGLSNVFVNIFLWKKSKDFTVIALYNLMHYIFVPLTFILAAWISKKKNGVWPLRFGVILFSVFFSLILLLKDNVTSYILPLGVLFGIAAGFYWLAFQELSFDYTGVDNRDTFNGFNGSVCGICSAVAPFAAALIIKMYGGQTGYTLVFSASLVLFSLLVIISMFLRSENYGKKLEFKKIIGNNCEDWKGLRKSIAVWGIRDVIMFFVITILVFETTGSEWMVGQLTLYASLVSSAAFVAQQKLIKPKRRIFSMWLGALIMFTAVFGLVYKINFNTLLFFMLLDAAFAPFFLVPLSSASFNIINRNHDEDLRAEYIVNKEIVLNLGRIASTLVLILILNLIKSERVLNYFLFIIGGVQIISLLFLVRLKIWKEESKS
jgi:MFS transporter, YQGE family, putative transporter